MCVCESHATKRHVCVGMLHGTGYPVAPLPPRELTVMSRNTFVPEYVVMSHAQHANDDFSCHMNHLLDMVHTKEKIHTITLADTDKKNSKGLRYVGSAAPKSLSQSQLPKLPWLDSSKAAPSAKHPTSGISTRERATFRGMKNPNDFSISCRKIHNNKNNSKYSHREQFTWYCIPVCYTKPGLCDAILQLCRQKLCEAHGPCYRYYTVVELVRSSCYTRDIKYIVSCRKLANRAPCKTNHPTIYSPGKSGALKKKLSGCN